MRVYFEKPRTTIGWKGLINDPHLDDSYDINTGLRRARSLLSYLATRGIPSATELLDPIVPQYIADLISWTAIGARTTESQTHREMASGLSMPIGFKNGTDGAFTTAINAMQSASKAHHFLGVNNNGMASIVNTTGNPDGHIVLRGGSKGPNFESQHVQRTSAELKQSNLPNRVMIDCSHGNSNKDFRKQFEVLKNIASQISNGEKNILGVMLESHLKEGNQKLLKKEDLEFGKSFNSKSWMIFNQKKSFFGTLTMFLTSLIVVYSIGYAKQNSLDFNYFAIAFLATILEQFSILGIDNLIVPISSALFFDFFMTI